MLILRVCVCALYITRFNIWHWMCTIPLDSFSRSRYQSKNVYMIKYTTKIREKKKFENWSSLLLLTKKNRQVIWHTLALSLNIYIKKSRIKNEKWAQTENDNLYCPDDTPWPSSNIISFFFIHSGCCIMSIDSNHTGKNNKQNYYM
jgi:hypothetical protein